jgi:CheY-like chemotaxis protein
VESKKILLVDDEEELLELIAKSLSNEGYEVTSVTTAEDAMDKARTLLPDLILIDIILPDMEGPEAVRALRQDSLTSNIPVIFLSGIVAREQGGQASSEILVGERRYKALSKPFSSTELLTEIRKVID